MPWGVVHTKRCEWRSLLRYWDPQERVTEDFCWERENRLCGLVSEVASRVYHHRLLQSVHVRSCMRSVFISFGPRGWKGSASHTDHIQGTCCWCGTLLFPWGMIEILFVFILFLDARGSVCGCICMYTHIHTHCTWGTLTWAQGRDKTLEGPEESRWTDLGIYVFVWMYKVHMCIYMLRGGIRSWTNCFLFYIIFSKIEKQKMWR